MATTNTTAHSLTGNKNMAMPKIPPHSLTDNANMAMQKTTTTSLTTLQQWNAANSPFLYKFPPEIRNIIYSLVLVSDNEVTLVDSRLADRMALLQVCSQIRQEAMLLFLAQNKFHIKMDVANMEASAGTKWLQALGFENASRLGKVIVCLRDSGFDKAVKDMQEADTFVTIDELRELVKPGSKTAEAVPARLLSLGVYITKLADCEDCALGPSFTRDTVTDADLPAMFQCIGAQDLMKGYWKSMDEEYQKTKGRLISELKHLQAAAAEKCREVRLSDT